MQLVVVGCFLTAGILAVVKAAFATQPASVELLHPELLETWEVDAPNTPPAAVAAAATPGVSPATTPTTVSWNSVVASLFPLLYHAVSERILEPHLQVPPRIIDTPVTFPGNDHQCQHNSLNLAGKYSASRIELKCFYSP